MANVIHVPATLASVCHGPPSLGRHLDTGVAETLAHGDQFDPGLQTGRGVVGAQRMEGSMRDQSAWPCVGTAT